MSLWAHNPPLQLNYAWWQVMVSEGQRALRRRTHALSMAGRRLLKHTSEQVVWQDGCFSVSAEAKVSTQESS